MKRAWTVHAVTRSETPRCRVVQLSCGQCASGVGAACDKYLAVRQKSRGMRTARRRHCTRSRKGPTVWVVQFDGSERSTDVLAANDKYLSIGKQRRCVGISTNTHAARGSKRPGGRVIELGARIMPTGYQHLAISEQCGGVENTIYRHTPSG